MGTLEPAGMIYAVADHDSFEAAVRALNKKYPGVTHVFNAQFEVTSTFQSGRSNLRGDGYIAKQ